MITLALENIRCFDKRQFTFDLNTFTLISGPSGVGKSTLFLALTFAITGESKHLCSLGKRKCQVTLTTPDITITRSKGPNRLVVKVAEVAYEDKVAQGYINLTFANFELGYIPQKLHKSFLAKTPAQKLEFIESFTFDLEYLTKLITNCKAMLSERKNNLLNARQHLTTCESLLVKHNIQKVNEQPCTDSLSTLQDQLSQATNELERWTRDIVITRERVARHTEAQQAYDDLLGQMSTIEMSVDSIKILLRATSKQELQWNDYQNALNHFNTLTVPDNLINLTELRQELTILTNIQKLEGTLSAKQLYIEKLKDSLSTLSSIPLETPLDTLLEIGVKLQEYVKAHEQVIKSEELIRKLNGLTVELDEQNKLTNKNFTLSRQLKLLELRQELQRLENLKKKLLKVQQCPYCCKPINIWNGTLGKGSHINLESATGSQEEQASVDNQIQTVELNIQMEIRQPTYIEPTMNHSELLAELTKVKACQLSTCDLDKLETRVYNLKNRTSASSHYAPLKETLLGTLRQKFKVIDDPLILAQTISKVKAMTLEIHNSTKVAENLKEQLDQDSKHLLLDLSYDEGHQLLKVTEPFLKAQDQVQLYKCSEPEHDSSTLEQTLQDKVRLEELSKVLKHTAPEHDLDTLLQTQAHLQERLSTLKSNLELTHAYNMWCDVALAKENVSHAELALARSYKLQGLITESKKEALDEVLDRMTTYTQMYLDEFFSEPINLKITFTDKVALDLVLHNTKIDLDALSGGEFDRVNLAITLALADMYQVGLLLMDESLASLDHTTSAKVLKAIKNLYRGTALCVAHQTVTGTFDKCIDLGN